MGKKFLFLIFLEDRHTYTSKTTISNMVMITVLYYVTATSFTLVIFPVKI